MASCAANAVSPLAAQLCERALLRGSFTLRSGATSDRYFDKYRVTCDPHLLAPVTAGLADLVRSAAPGATLIVAPALGAVPLATALSLATGLPFVIVRDEPKSHGTSRAIEGQVPTGACAVLVEDVVTSGSAAVAAALTAVGAGIDVVASVCVLDRDGGGREALAELGAPLTSLLSAADLDAAFDAGIGEATTATAVTGAARPHV